jgi:large subunit ribosomal protein L9
MNLAKELTASLTGKFVVLVKQAPEDGKIFGSVTTREIAKSLLQECEIDHRKISFNGVKIRSLGEYQVDMEFHSEVVVPITVHVVRSETDAHELRQVKLQSQKSQQQESRTTEQEDINDK